MSSRSDDSSQAPTSAAEFQEVISGPDSSLEDGLIDRYLLGTLRPEEADWAATFFADPTRRGLLRRFLEQIEGDADALAPDTARAFEELRSQICDFAPVVDSKNAKMAGRESAEVVLQRRLNNALGKQTLRTARQKEGVFSGQTLRRWVGGGSRTVWGTTTLGKRSISRALGALVTLALVVGLLRFNRRQDRGVTHTYTTSSTQIAWIRLPDGTKVRLSPGAALHLVNYGAAERTVMLEHGEGFFEVAQASGVPFVVRSGRVETRVLGTSFLVRHSANSHRVRVSVASGKVNVTGAALGDAPLLLTAGRIGDVTDSIAQVMTAVDEAPQMALEDGQMVFRHAPVSRVLAGLSRWYGYRFRCQDSALTQQRVTVGLSTQSSAMALAMLERILRVNLTIVGDTVTLTPRPTRADHNLPRTRTYDVWTPNKEVGR